MQIEPPGHDELIAFMNKLGELRRSLSPIEQELLDRMTAAMLTSEAQDPTSESVPKLEQLSADPQEPPSNKTYYAQVAYILKS